MARWCVEGAALLDGAGRESFVADGLFEEIRNGQIGPELEGHYVDGRKLGLARGLADLNSDSDLYSTVRNGLGPPVGDRPKLSQAARPGCLGRTGSRRPRGEQRLPIPCPGVWLARH